MIRTIGPTGSSPATSKDDVRKALSGFGRIQEAFSTITMRDVTIVLNLVPSACLGPLGGRGNALIACMVKKYVLSSRMFLFSVTCGSISSTDT